MSELEKRDVEFTGSNKVAFKFIILVTIIKIVGYCLTCIWSGIVIITTGVLQSIVILLIGIILTWLSTLFLEAIAETLNLLQDIKNNTEND